MKQEYDFSKGERGRFFREDAKLTYPYIWTKRCTAIFKNGLNQKV